MLVLDTDHLTEIDRGSPIGASLRLRLASSNEDVFATIISAEEQIRGWLAQISRTRDLRKQVDAYARFQRRLVFYASWRVLPWTNQAAERFNELRASGVRIGTMDLKIAAITLTEGATLLSRNLGDFRQVPGLTAEDWL
jgi:tRNA(fMet)-specific endonuclease VapC